MTSKQFKVIVVGGGPVGLTAAHALRLAGVDFILLERRQKIVEDVGSSLVLGPPAFRVFQQFGILEKILSCGTALESKEVYSIDGSHLETSNPFQYIRRAFGTSLRAFHRAQLVETLYETLPVHVKSKLMASKNVSNIEQFDNGVSVTCADGTVYEASIVLGADGVHSKTRRIMREQALKSDPLSEWDPEYPFLSTYRCMWGSFPPSSPGLTCETQHKDRSVMFLGGNTRDWIFVYEKLAQPTSEYVKYTEEETEAYANSFASFPVTKSLRLKDMLPHRQTIGLANLEEGICKYWSRGRLVLAGDACHKYTPNAGAGYRSGIQDITVLCNKLRKAIAAAPDGLPSTSALTKVFQSYQEERIPVTVKNNTFSAALTRQHAWADWKHYIMARFILTLRVVQYVLLAWVMPMDEKKAPVLDYVTVEEEHFSGTVQWVHQMKGAEKSS